MFRKLTAVQFILVAASLSGCNWTEVNFYPASAFTAHSGKTPSTIELIRDTKPAKPYRDVGGYRSYGNAQNEYEGLEKLKEDAAARGIDGVHSIRCGAPGTTGAGICNGTAFIWVDEAK